MRSPIIVSPLQSAHFAMGRVLLTFAQWNELYKIPLELERAMVIDFAVQYPRSFTGLLPLLSNIVQSHGLQDADVGDYFAARKFFFVREQFVDTVSDLIARNLLEPILKDANSEFSSFQITPLGETAASQFSSPLAGVIQLLSHTFAKNWGDITVKRLLLLIKQTLPDQSEMVQQLTSPFGSWLDEPEQ